MVNFFAGILGVVFVFMAVESAETGNPVFYDAIFEHYGRLITIILILLGYGFFIWLDNRVGNHYETFHR